MISAPPEARAWPPRVATEIRGAEFDHLVAINVLSGASEVLRASPMSSAQIPQRFVKARGQSTVRVTNARVAA